MLPANGKVSIGWQIVFTFLPIVNFWVFYRIRKLRKYLLYVIVPSVVVSTTIAYTFSNMKRFTQWGDDGLAFGNPYPFDMLAILSNLIGAGLQALAIYLVIIWSRQHNRQFDQPSMQPSQ